MVWLEAGVGEWDKLEIFWQSGRKRAFLCSGIRAVKMLNFFRFSRFQRNAKWFRSVETFFKCVRQKGVA